MATLLGRKPPFRRPRDGLVVGCEEGNKWNWFGSCGGGTGCRRTFCAVDRDLDLLGTLAGMKIPLRDGRLRPNKHAVPLHYRIGRWCAR